MSTPLLEIDQIECRYDDQTVVQDLSFAIDQVGVSCLLGPSGCGKTTALRAIAGFEPVHAGEIRRDGKIISRAGMVLPPEQRGFGMVFQDFALFPHLTVSDNVCFGLRKQTSRQRQQTCDSLLELLDMSGFQDRYPHELSGGQQQRIALARALAPKPGLILMDEPFSSLDVDLRERLARDIHDVLIEQGTAGIVVTHDQNEAFAMGDKIGVMYQGKLQQWDSPYALYHEPKTRFVADFIGQGRFLKGTVRDEFSIDTEIGPIRRPARPDRPQCKPGDSVDVLLRPDDVVYDKDSTMTATVSKRAFQGAEILYTLELATGTSLLSLLPSHQNFNIGDQINIRLDTEHVVAFPA